MRNDSLLAGIAFLWALALAAPAGAITIGGIDYAFFAETAIKVEDGTVNILGDVAVSDAGGLLRLGGGNTIVGTATADRMSFGASSHVTACEFNRAMRGDPGAACGTEAPATVPITAWPPFPVPETDPCVQAGQNNLTVPVGGAASPLPGSCFGAVDVKQGGTLTLSPGAAYNFKSIRLHAGSALNGNDAVVNVKGRIVTEALVTVAGVTINSSASRGSVIGVGSNSTLQGVVLIAPNATVRVRAGTLVGTDVEVLARRIILGPITVVIP